MEEDLEPETKVGIGILEFLSKQTELSPITALRGLESALVCFALGLNIPKAKLKKEIIFFIEESYQLHSNEVA